MVSFGFLSFGGDGGSRSVSFCAHRHAAPKNSSPNCFLNGCFDYYFYYLEKECQKALFSKWWRWR